MFIHEQSNQTIYANLNETIIRATHRPQDLIPGFMTVIRDSPEYAALLNTVPAYAMEDEDEEYWNTEDCMYLLEELFDILNSYAPMGYIFGPHIGDGSDFGYWKLPEEDII